MNQHLMSIAQHCKSCDNVRPHLDTDYRSHSLSMFSTLFIAKEHTHIAQERGLKLSLHWQLFTQLRMYSTYTELSFMQLHIMKKHVLFVYICLAGLCKLFFLIYFQLQRRINFHCAIIFSKIANSCTFLYFFTVQYIFRINQIRSLVNLKITRLDMFLKFQITTERGIITN